MYSRRPILYFILEFSQFKLIVSFLHMISNNVNCNVNSYILVRNQGNITHAIWTRPVKNGMFDVDSCAGCTNSLRTQVLNFKKIYAHDFSK